MELYEKYSKLATAVQLLPDCDVRRKLELNRCFVLFWATQHWQDPNKTFITLFQAQQLSVCLNFEPLDHTNQISKKQHVPLFKVFDAVNLYMKKQHPVQILFRDLHNFTYDIQYYSTATDVYSARSLDFGGYHMFDVSKFQNAVNQNK